MTALQIRNEHREKFIIIIFVAALGVSLGSLLLNALSYFSADFGTMAYAPASLLAFIITMSSLLLGVRVAATLRTKECELSARVGMLEAVINHASEGIIVLSQDKIIRSANSAAQAMFQYSALELMGQQIDTIIPPIDNSNHKKGINSNDGPDLDLLVRERLGKKKNGKTFSIELSVAALRYEKQSLITLIISDITERKSMERRLIQAEKMNSIGYLAAGVAHEINTPIQYISNNIAFIRNEFEKMDLALSCYEELYQSAKTNSVSSALLIKVEKEAEELEIEYLRKEIPTAIRESIEGIDRVADIVRSLKEFAHPGQDEKAPVDINELIESTATVSRNSWKYVADLQTNLDRTLPPIPAYASDLKQVVLNLIINAAQAIEEKCGKEGVEKKGSIIVSTTRNADNLELTIYDSGTGIPTDHRELIFEPFYTTKEIGKGTGQGLAISKRIIAEKHQGTIDFLSMPGESTTFRILLPMSEE